MTRTCLACRHPDRDAIDRDLLAGVPKRSIAARYGLSAGSAQRHRAHLSEPVLAEWSASQAEIYAGLAEYTAQLERDARRIATEARENGHPRLELQALAASRAHVELMAKLATASQQLEPEDRRKYGLTGARVFRNQQEQNEVVVLFDWSEEGYERFMAGRQTREIMASAGPQGPPEHTAVEPVGETGS